MLAFWERARSGNPLKNKRDTKGFGGRERFRWGAKIEADGVNVNGRAATGETLSSSSSSFLGRVRGLNVRA